MTLYSTKMLYVFYVDLGVMLKLDINLAMQKAFKLKESISKYHNISIEKQVLLVSGGEVVDPLRNVSSYYAGSDASNPFFLFNKDALESTFTIPDTLAHSKRNLDKETRSLIDAPFSFETVSSRTKLAQNFEEEDKILEEMCRNLVHEEHLQHQGWSAVIANMEDAVQTYQSKVQIFLQNLDMFLSQSNYFQNIIERFPNLISLLQNIQIPVNLFHISDAPKTLFDWIHLQDSKSSLTQLLEQCKDGLAQFTSNIKDVQLKEVSRIVEEIVNDRKEMKKIGGLEERLRRLDKLMIYMEGIVKQQQELSQVFSNIQTRTQNINDTSMLHDICENHKQTLEIMLCNHHHMIDGEQKCRRTKQELCKNLNYRLKWVMLTQQSLLEIDNRLMMRQEALNVLNDKFLIAMQVEKSPQIFCQTVVEIHRRKKFSTYFKKFALEVYSKSDHLCEVEVQRRKSFAIIIDGHFLKFLFPGLEDLPLLFLSKPNESLDSRLPEISEDIIRDFQDSLPELQEYLKLDRDSFDSNFQMESSNLNTLNQQKIFTDEIELDNLNSYPIVKIDNLNEQFDFTYNKEDSKSFIFESPRSSNYQSFMTKNINEGDMSKLNLNQDLNNDLKRFVEDDDIFLDAEILQDEIISSPNMLQPFETIKDEEVNDADILMLQQQQQDFMTADFYIEESFSGSTLNLPNKQFDFDISPCSSPLKQNRMDSLTIINDKLTDLQSCHKDLKSESNELFQQLLFDFTIYKSQIKDQLMLKINKILDFKYCQLADLNIKLNDSYETIKKLESTLEDRSLDLDRIMETLKKAAIESDQKLNSITLENEFELERIKNEQINEIKVKELKIEQLENLLAEQCLILVATTQEKDNIIESLLLKLELERKTFHDALIHESIKYEGSSNQLSNLCTEFHNQINCFKTEFNNAYQTINKCELINNLDASERYSKAKMEINSFMDSHIDSLITNYANNLHKIESFWKSRNVLLENKIDTLESEKNDIHRKQVESHQNLSNSEKNINDSSKNYLEEFIFEKELNMETNLNSKKICSDIDTQIFTSNISKSLNEQILSSDITKSQENQQDLVVNEQIIQLKEIEAEILKSQNEEKYGNKIESKTEEQSCGEIQFDKKEIKQNQDMNSELLKNQICDEFEFATRQLQYETSKDLEQLRADLGDEVFKKVDSKISKLKELHKNEVELLQIQMNKKFDLNLELVCNQLEEVRQKDIDLTRKECEMEMEKIKRKMREEAEAKNQILFNEAFMSALKDKNKNIENLEKKIQEIQESIMVNSCNIPASHLEGSGFGDSASKLMAQSCILKQEPNKINFLEMALKHKIDENRRLREKLAASSFNSLNLHISLRSCNEGDIVLFVWDIDSNHYLAYLISSPLKHFLHSDCLALLQLQDQITKNNPKEWVLAVVINKELCQAKKATNRFNVPHGSKFYRVKVRPFFIQEFELVSSTINTQISSTPISNTDTTNLETKSISVQSFK